jgi:hypothetical protein
MGYYGLFTPEFLDICNSVSASYKSMNQSLFFDEVVVEALKICEKGNVIAFSPDMNRLYKQCQPAALIQVYIRGLFHGLIEKNDAMANRALRLISYTANLITSASIYGADWLSCKTVSFFSGCSETLEIGFQTYVKTKQIPISTCLKFNIPQTITEFIDCVTLCRSIVEKRIVYMDNDFLICYGRLNAQKVGELMIAKVDKTGIWSLDKDTATKPLSISSLRRAKKAVDGWKGTKLIGEITHAESERISSYLGLVPVPGKEGFVMIPQRKAVGFLVNN